MSCDDSVFLNDGHYYAASQEKMEFYQRYLRVFDELRLVTRCEVNKPMRQGFVPLDSDPRIEYVAVPEFHGPIEYAAVYFETGKVLKNITDGCDAAVLRIPSTIAMRVGNQVMKKKIPYVCEVVYDAEDGWRGSKGLNRLLWKQIDSGMRRMCYGADGVSCVTKYYLQQHYFSKKKGAFVSYYSSLALDKSFYGGRKEFPLHRPIVIAHTSSQVAYNGRKGYNQVIQALQIIKSRGVDVKVKFVGPDYQNGISQLIQYANSLHVADMVEFVGYLSRYELEHFLSQADMYVMPTKAEGLPRVVIEAMAKGLPCITTPVSGNPELIDEHFLVDYYDIKTLCDRILELAQDKNLYEQTSRQNYEHSLQYEASILQLRRDEFYSNLKRRIS